MAIRNQAFFIQRDGKEWGGGGGGRLGGSVGFQGDQRVFSRCQQSLKGGLWNIDCHEGGSLNATEHRA